MREISRVFFFNANVTESKILKVDNFDATFVISFLVLGFVDQSILW